MDQSTVAAVLFAASAIVAAIAAVRDDIFAKVEKRALAICLAAAAFFVEAQHWFGG